MFAGAMIICFGIVGIIYKVWTNQIADYEQKRNQEKIRQTELAAVKAQNDKYQERLSNLETRINTIQALQNSRVGPVELMNTLGGIVGRTNDIYLYTLTPVGERFQLKGQSSTVDSMASLLAFLKNSGFYNDVQLEQFYQDDLHAHQAYKFSVSAQFKSPKGGVSPTAGGAPANPAGPSGPVPGLPGRPGPLPGQPGASPQSQPQRLVR